MKKTQEELVVAAMKALEELENHPEFNKEGRTDCFQGNVSLTRGELRREASHKLLLLKASVVCYPN